MYSVGAISYCGFSSDICYKYAKRPEAEKQSVSAVFSWETCCVWSAFYSKWALLSGSLSSCNRSGQTEDAITGTSLDISGQNLQLIQRCDKIKTSCAGCGDFLVIFGQRFIYSFLIQCQQPKMAWTKPQGKQVKCTFNTALLPCKWGSSTNIEDV